jgi:hypothetical protein
MPFEPIIFDKMTIEPGKGKLSDRWYHRHLMSTSDNGVIPIVASGDGALLITRKVLETIPYPWWEYGETTPGMVDHDMVFSRKVRDAGFELFCDTNLWVDHVGIFAVTPFRDEDGKWWVKLRQGNRELLVKAPDLSDSTFIAGE